jgi:hypothetical protein
MAIGPDPVPSISAIAEAIRHHTQCLTHALKQAHEAGLYVSIDVNDRAQRVHSSLASYAPYSLSAGDRLKVLQISKTTLVQL